MGNRNSLAATMAGAALVAATLCACSPDAAEPGPTPQTYDIDKSDLTAAEPNDICRTRHPAFLRDLLLRISEGLPPGSSGFDFTDLRVRKSEAGGAWTAIVRFHIALPGEPAQTMRAVASFDPEDCRTGDWSVHRGEGADEG